jgi:hypothetical protein
VKDTKKKLTNSTQTLSESKSAAKIQDNKVDSSDAITTSALEKTAVKSHNSTKKADSTKVKKETTADKDLLNSDVTSLGDLTVAKKPVVEEEKNSSAVLDVKQPIHQK